MRKSLLAAATATAALLLASCAMPADDPSYNASGEGLDSAAASAVAADQDALTALLAAPTSIGVDAPLAAPPASGASIISLTDGSEYSNVFEASLAEAGDVLGWTVESVVVDPADPTAVGAAFDDAVGRKPAGIHITGLFADALAANLPAAETAGIPVICTGCSGDPANGITDTSINGTAQNTAWGSAMATYVVQNQYEGEDAGVQYFSIPGGAISDFNTQFNATLLNQCRNCSATESLVDPLMVPLNDPDAIVSFVSSEMSTALGAWALLDTGVLSAGVVDALANDPTLLSPVVVIGRGAAAGDIASLQALNGAGPAMAGAASGDAASSAASAEPSVEPSPEAAASGEAVDEFLTGGRTPEEAATLQAWIGISQPVMAWRVIDQFARIVGGAEPAIGDLPSQLLMGTNVADAVLDDSGNYVGIADYQDQFKALWGVS